MKTDDNRPQAVRTAEYYDQMWEEDGRTPEQMAPPNSSGEARLHFIQHALERIAQQNEHTIQILDLGCGSGWIETGIHMYGEVTAVDFSKRAIQRAQEQYGSYATFVLGDPSHPRLGFPDDLLFDAVVTSEVIEHVEDQPAFVEQIANYLKPNGYCILTTPNRAVWEPYRQDERYHKWIQPIENWVTARELVALFNNGGFEIIQHEGWSNMSYPYKPLFVPLQTRRGKKVFRLLGLMGLWKRIMRDHGFLQLMVARRSS
jgi:2-polyprenyl-3-methyl-5-hydroxy-6-metoxy-1,4-benzoquinol methylase